MTARPCANDSTKLATARASLAGRTRSTRSAQRPMRSGWPASTNRSPSPVRAASAASCPPSLTRANAVGSPETPDPGISATNTPKSSRTVIRSSSRSRMIVANAAVALRFSFRASRYGRITSPARAGSRKLAANPITVVRKAFAKWVGPIGASRYCQRSARSTYVSAVTIRASTSRSVRALRVSAHTPAISALRRKNASSPMVRRQMRTVRTRDRMPSDSRV